MSIEEQKKTELVLTPYPMQAGEYAVAALVLNVELRDCGTL